MANLGGFNAHEVAPSVGFEPLPASKYLAIISDSEMKPTKNNDGQYLKLTFQIIDGKYKSRQLWTNLNLSNKSAKAVEIAKAELSAICRAVGVMQPQDSVELHNLPIVIDVRCEKREGTDQIDNRIKGYLPREAGIGPASPGGVPAMVGVGPGNGTAVIPPWQKPAKL